MKCHYDFQHSFPEGLLLVHSYNYDEKGLWTAWCSNANSPSINPADYMSSISLEQKLRDIIINEIWHAECLHGSIAIKDAKLLLLHKIYGIVVSGAETSKNGIKD